MFLVIYLIDSAISIDGPPNGQPASNSIGKNSSVRDEQLLHREVRIAADANLVHAIGQSVCIDVHHVLDSCHSVSFVHLLYKGSTHCVEVHSQAHVLTHHEGELAHVVGWVRSKSRDANRLLDTSDTRDVDGATSVTTRNRSIAVFEIAAHCLTV